MKIYKGYELLKAIAEGEIQEGAKIEIIGRFADDLIGSYFIYNEGTIDYIIYTPEGMQYDEVKLFDLLNYRFKAIENETDIQEINIQEIKELENEVIQEDWTRYAIQHHNTINELIQAIKQIDDKINTKYCCNCGVELTEENKALPNMCSECKYREEK